VLPHAKGIGPVGADIFLREAQIVWHEAFPYADRRVLEVAKRLSLPGSAEELSKLGCRKDFVRLTAALIRTARAKDYQQVRSCAVG